MGFIDSIVAKFSPKAAYEREAYRRAYDWLRNYDAGNYDRPNQNWRVSNQSAELTDRYSRMEVLARARDLERNSDIMNSVIGVFERNIIGGGFSLQAQTEEPDLNKDIEKAWKKWCKKRNCDVTGTQSLNQMLRMAVHRKKVDGGILFVKRYTSDGFVPFKLQMVEVDELDGDTMTPHFKGNKVIGGIEFNKWNKPVGYFIKQYDLEGMSINDPVWIKADDVIFYYSKKRPSQIREMSDMAPTITRVRDVNEFMMAVSVKQRIEACLSVFIKKSIPTTGIGRSGAGAVEKTSYDGKMLSPGMIKELNAGDEVQVVNPAGQAADATSFTKLQQRLIGAGQGISYEAMSRDMSESNYSSARQGIIEDDLTCASEWELLSEVMDEIYETFVISAVLCGKLNIPKFWDEGEKERYLSHQWIKAPKPWIDPVKESTADRTALETGQKTFKQVCSENGKDWRIQLDDMAEVNAYAAGLGIDLNSILFGTAKSDNSSNLLNDDEDK